METDKQNFEHEDYSRSALKVITVFTKEVLHVSLLGALVLVTVEAQIKVLYSVCLCLYCMQISSKHKLYCNYLSVCIHYCCFQCMQCYGSFHIDTIHRPALTTYLYFKLYCMHKLIANIEMKFTTGSEVSLVVFLRSGIYTNFVEKYTLLM